MKTYIFYKLADIKTRTCFNFKFKRGYYPYFLLGVCIVIQFGIDLTMVVGLGYGLFQTQIEKITSFPSVFVAKLAGLVNINSI